MQASITRTIAAIAKLSIAGSLLLFSMLLGFAAAQEDRKRIAVVIGNSNYESSRLEQLPNAANDAEKLSESLRRLNFEVVKATNVTSQRMESLIREVEMRLPEASAVLIFYAGHGVQLAGENYLLPVDTPDPENAEALVSRAAKLNDIIGRFASRERSTFVFLDACRNNPLGSQAGTFNGLAQLEVGENVFIAFATQPGNVSADGIGRNSPFTTALLRNIEIPGLSVSDLMIRVRNETEALTYGRQVPWDQSDLREQFYFTEQQVIDPVALSESLSLILADPNAKQKLQAELAANDLQTAVLVVSQTLRTAGASGTGAQAAPLKGGTVVASLEPDKGLEQAKQEVISDIGTLIVGSVEADAREDKKRAQAAELARGVQTELRRLGCYRMKVDGDWGRGSARALRDYYANTGQDVGDTQPSVELLSELFLRSGRVCKAPVIIPKVKTAATGTTASSTSKKKRSEGQQAPAPPPPDISGGIGIGGIF